MKKRIKFICIIIVIYSLIYGCEFDYDLDGNQNTFIPKVVLNGLISPAEDISIYMSWSKHYTSKEYPTPNPRGIAKLYENNKLINETPIDESMFDGTISIPYKVKAGSNYKIVVDVEDYGVVEAETTIPYAGSAQGEFLEKRQTSIFDNSHSFYHAQFNEINIPHLMRAVWIRLNVAHKFKNGDENLRILKSSLANTIYTNNLYVDNFNLGTEGNDEPFEGNTLASGGVLYYKNSLRIPYKLIELSQPLTIAGLFNDSIIWRFLDEEYEDFDGGTTVPVSDMAVEVIFPSDDYDKYVKDVYRQSDLVFDTSFPMFSETVYVHSNVKNGLGIFAGYNSIELDLPIKK